MADDPGIPPGIPVIDLEDDSEIPVIDLTAIDSSPEVDQEKKKKKKKGKVMKTRNRDPSHSSSRSFPPSSMHQRRPRSASPLILQGPFKQPIKRRLANTTETKRFFQPSNEVAESFGVHPSRPTLSSYSSSPRYTTTKSSSAPLKLQHPPATGARRPLPPKELQTQRRQSGSDFLFNRPLISILKNSASRTANSHQTGPHIAANHTASPDLHSMETHRTGPATCDEDPATWDDHQLETTLHFLRYEEAAEPAEGACQDTDVVHHGPVRSCKNTEAHGADTPFNVCAGCRERGVQKLRKSKPELLATHILPICAECYNIWRAGMASGQQQPGRQNWHWVCTCGSGWKCHECRVSELEAAKIKAEVEKEMRRGPVGLEFVQGPFLVNPNGMSFLKMGDLCCCGNELMGTEKIFKCAGCDGIVLDR